jgi:hypothetical protein
LKNLAAGCEESSIPMERKLTYSRSLAPKHASGEKANDKITKREAQLPYLGERSDNALAVGFTKRKNIFTGVFSPAETGRELRFACYKSI